MKNWLIKNGFKAIVFCVLFFVIIGGLTMALWNSLIPELFKGPRITFVQAVGIILLSKILFGGFRPGWNNCSCKQTDKNHWKKRWEDKISCLSPEEKEKLKSKMADKCGWWSEGDVPSQNITS